MNSGYTLMSIGALLLFMMAAINANRVVVDSDSEALKSEQYVECASIVRSIFGEIRLKKYDQLAPDTTTVVNPASFTLPATLGPEMGELFTLPDTGVFKSASMYNDIDDYNGYTRIVVTPTASDTVSVQVSYVDSINFNTSATRTYLKKIAVTVQSRPRVSPETFSTIQAY